MQAEDPDEREGEHGAQVGLPGLPLPGVDAEDPVDRALDAPVVLARVRAGEVVADGAVEEAEDDDEGRDGGEEEPALHQKRSGASRASRR